MKDYVVHLSLTHCMLGNIGGHFENSDPLNIIEFCKLLDLIDQYTPGTEKKYFGVTWFIFQPWIQILQFLVAILNLYKFHMRAILTG